MDPGKPEINPDGAGTRAWPRVSQGDLGTTTSNAVDEHKTGLKCQQFHLYSSSSSYTIPQGLVTNRTRTNYP